MKGFTLGRRKFGFQISPQEWQENIQIRQADSYRSLKGYSGIFAKKVAQENPHCVLVFKYNRVRKVRSRKGHMPFFHGKASCKFEGCTKYDFVIRKSVRPGARVKVRVKVTGEINHVEDERHRCSTSRDARPDDACYSNAENATEASLLSGNCNVVRTKLAVDQPFNKLLQKELMNRDVFREIDIVSEITAELVPGGFIQYVSRKPLGVIMYTEEQMQVLCDMVREETATLFIDATGSVVKKLPGQPHKVLYYALVVKGHSNGKPIPVAEFVSSEHTVPDVTNFLMRVRYELQQKDQESNVPQQVVVNYNWDLIHAINLSFNNMTTASFLEYAWNNVPPPCKLRICSTHLMRSVAGHLRCAKVTLKRLILLCVACLIQASSRDQLDHMFSLMCKVLLSRETPSEKTLEQLQAQLIGVVIECDPEQLDGCFLPEETFNTSWVIQSPYYRHYHSMKSVFDDNSVGRVKNPYYAPLFVSYFLYGYMSIAPLWTGILDGGTHVTNATVENWFRIVKENILDNKKRLRPGQFVRAMAGSLNGRMREFDHYQG